MSWFIAIFIFSVYADPPGAAYRTSEKTQDPNQCSDLDATCTSQPQKVVEQEADRDPDAEKRCTDKELFKNPAERESCRNVEARNRRARAEQRERAEAEVGALVDTQKPACAFEEVKANCETFYMSAIKDKDRSEDKIKSCENECSVSSFSVKRQLMSCTAEEKNNAGEYLTTRRKYCGTSGFAATEGSESSDDESKPMSAEEAKALASANEYMAKNGGTGVFRVADLKGEGPGYCVAGVDKAEVIRNCYTDSGKPFKYKHTGEMTYADTRATDMLSSGGGTIESADNYHQQRCVRYSNGGKGCIAAVKSLETPMYSYISPSGQTYASFESYQAAQNGQVTPAAPPVRGRGTAAIVDPVAAKPITGGTTGGEQRLTRDTAASGNNSGGNGNAGSQSAGATNSGKPQQTAATNGGSGSGSGSNGGGGGGGLAGGGSSSGGSNGFSNPYANTNLDLSGKQGNKSQFAALSDRDTSSMVNEGVSGDGGSSGYDNFGGNGGFGKNNGVRVASSEGVNRDSPISGSSALGGAVTPAVAAYSDKNPVLKAKMEDIGSANFQSGFHKANGKEALSPSSLSKTNAILAKMDKAKRRKIMDQCKGNMSCIASILGVTKSRRSAGGRGIASVEGQQLPKGVWTGYTDILSHMAKVHDKIPINYDGEID